MSLFISLFHLLGLLVTSSDVVPFNTSKELLALTLLSHIGLHPRVPDLHPAAYIDVEMFEKCQP